MWYNKNIKTILGPVQCPKMNQNFERCADGVLLYVVHWRCADGVLFPPQAFQGLLEFGLVSAPTRDRQLQ